ncbi:hypothetical protein PhCBS80983_g02366 [Powellomyces hirtus]|uniref:Uncharacterized protein n=1 Tax=Powellomyces hirtus TaxID=109895 RepID=A0A507E6A5_9FUNG|nr:hypothetical protein PhCBS80983_g02366 [Powellomyces hirtus]
MSAVPPPTNTTHPNAATTGQQQPTVMSGVVNTAVNTAEKVVAAMEPYTPQIAKDAATYAFATAQSSSERGLAAAQSTQAYATTKVAAALDFGKVVVTGATTTITTTLVSLTPNPILHLLQTTLERAKEVKDHPRDYVPAYVVHAGERTYEIVHHAQERGLEAQGVIVTKINGVVDKVTSVPQIHALIEQLQKLTAPVLQKLGVSSAHKPVEPNLTVVDPAVGAPAKE